MKSRVSKNMESIPSRPPLSSLTAMRGRAIFNRLFAAAYSLSLLALFYRHATTVLHSASIISLLMLGADAVLAFLFCTAQGFRIYPVFRREFPENLARSVDFPALDVFVCTADPDKEPPIGVANTALSVLAYDYPGEKLSVYVSDDGGSELTLFAFMEAAKFGRVWVPFCRENKVEDRCPEVFFRTSCSDSKPETLEIKMMYESMKTKVENVVKKGTVCEEYITNEQDLQVFNKWSQGLFTRHDHPAVIQVLLDNGTDKDVHGHPMPNLIYVSRQKSKAFPHHFKAGALNALLRVSAVLTNAPMILTLDCDMYSNDPMTPYRVLCYFLDQSVRPKLGYIQLPQSFDGLNRTDIYGCEFKRLFLINPLGLDGLSGPDYFGTGAFFQRRAFFGSPLSFVQPEMPELSPYNTISKSVIAQPNLLKLAKHVAGCEYEIKTNWGSKIGFRYGSLVEDYYTGYRLHCEGWISIFCNPPRPAFFGDAPISLSDVVSQTRRWSVGLLEVAISKSSPITFGVKALGLFMGFCYSHYAFWPLSSIPIIIYSFLPQLTLLNGISIFPKVSDPWFILYCFLFLGAYGQDCLEFILAQGTVERWWSDQRMWLIRGLTSCLFGTMEYLTKQLGIVTRGFNITSKVVDEEESKRYELGTFDFGDSSPVFVPLATAAIINLLAFIGGMVKVFKGGNLDGLFGQMFVAGFGVLNSLQFYEAMAFRTDKGRVPRKITIISIILALGVHTAFSLFLNLRY